MKTKLFLPVFYTLTILFLVSEYVHIFSLSLIFKTILMPFLMVYYYSHIKNQINKFHKIILTAFFFSWLGDTVLMFDKSSPLFFIFGLGSFLTTHLIYIYAFTMTKHKFSLLKSKPYLIFPILIYAITLFVLLQPHLKELLIPVSVYTLAIFCMVVMSLNRWKNTNSKSFWYIFVGAVLFMFSDSFLSWNIFVEHKIYFSSIIMLLYTTGQFLIAKGCIEQE